MIKKKKLSIWLLGFIPIIFLVEDNAFMMARYISLLFFLFIIFVTLLEMNINKEKIIISEVTFASGFLIIYLLSFSFKMEEAKYLGNVLAIVLMLGILFITTLRQFSNFEIIFIEKMNVSLCTIIALILILVPKYYIGTRRTITNLNGISIDPNFLGGILCIGTIISLHLLFTKRKIRYLLFSSILIYSILLTGSRASFVGVVLGCIFSFLYLWLNLEKNKKNVFLGSCALFFGVLIAIFAIFYMPDKMFDRFIGNSYLDSSNMQRLLAWKHGISLILDKPFLGYGNIPVPVMMEKTGFKAMDIHNTVLLMTYHYGFFGLLGLGLLWLVIVKNCFVKKNIIYLAITVSLFFMSFIISNLRSIYYWYYLMFVWIASCSICNRRNVK